MASELLQSMQFGANLYDRAQTQRRMVDQLNLQVADQVMRQKTADLQSQIQQLHLRDALEDKEAQLQDAPAFYDYQKQVNNYLSSTSDTAPLPSPPQFKSKAFRLESENLMKQLQDFSPRKAMMEAQANTKQLRIAAQTQKLRNANDLLAVAGVDVFDPETGQLDETLYKESIPMLPHVTAYNKSSQAVRERTSSLMSGEGLSFKDALIKSSKELSDIKMAPKDTALKRNADYFEAALREDAKATGKPLDEEFISAKMVKFMASGGRIPQMPALLAKAMDDKFAVLESVYTLEDRTTKFDSTYGAGEFEKTLGLIQTKFRDVEALFLAEKNPKKKAALSVMSDFSALLNQKARTTSGLTVTEGEANRIRQEVGAVFDANTLTKLAALKRRDEVHLKGEVMRNIDYQLPKYMGTWAATIDAPLRITPTSSRVSYDTEADVPDDLPDGTPIIVGGKPATFRR